MDRIFERFYHINGSPGHGFDLELTVYNEIAEQHKALFKMSKCEIKSPTRIDLKFDEP